MASKGRHYSKLFIYLSLHSIYAMINEICAVIKCASIVYYLLFIIYYVLFVIYHLLYPSQRGAPCEGTNSAGRFITPGYFHEHSGIQSCPNSMSWTLDAQWSWLLCAFTRIEQVKTGNQHLLIGWGKKFVFEWLTLFCKLFFKNVL